MSNSNSSNSNSNKRYMKTVVKEHTVRPVLTLLEVERIQYLLDCAIQKKVADIDGMLDYPLLHRVTGILHKQRAQILAAGTAEGGRNTTIAVDSAVSTVVGSSSQDSTEGSGNRASNSTTNATTNSKLGEAEYNLYRLITDAGGDPEQVMEEEKLILVAAYKFNAGMTRTEVEERRAMRYAMREFMPAAEPAADADADANTAKSDSKSLVTRAPITSSDL